MFKKIILITMLCTVLLTGCSKRMDSATLEETTPFEQVDTKAVVQEVIKYINEETLNIQAKLDSQSTVVVEGIRKPIAQVFEYTIIRNAGKKTTRISQNISRRYLDIDEKIKKTYNSKKYLHDTIYQYILDRYKEFSAEVLKEENVYQVQGTIPIEVFRNTLEILIADEEMLGQNIFGNYKDLEANVILNIDKATSKPISLSVDMSESMGEIINQAIEQDSYSYDISVFEFVFEYVHK